MNTLYISFLLRHVSISTSSISHSVPNCLTSSRPNRAVTHCCCMKVCLTLSERYLPYELSCPSDVLRFCKSVSLSVTISQKGRDVTLPKRSNQSTCLLISLSALPVEGEGKELTLDLMHINDIHSYFEETNKVGLQ